MLVMFPPLSFLGRKHPKHSGARCIICLQQVLRSVRWPRPGTGGGGGAGSFGSRPGATHTAPPASQLVGPCWLRSKELPPSPRFSPLPASCVRLVSRLDWKPSQLHIGAGLGSPVVVSPFLYKTTVSRAVRKGRGAGEGSLPPPLGWYTL